MEWIFSYNYNKIRILKHTIMEEKLNQRLLEQLVIEVKELKEKVDRLNGKGNIYQNNKPVDISKDKLPRKDLPFLKKLLEKNTNPKTDKFLLSIINNDYPTLTVGQKNAIDSIAQNLNVVTATPTPTPAFTL